jgi:hypothetical protein
MVNDEPNIWEESGRKMHQFYEICVLRRKTKTETTGVRSDVLLLSSR